MNPFHISVAVAGAANLLVGGYVLLRFYKERAGCLAAVFSWSLAVWAFGDLSAFLSRSPEEALRLGFISTIGASLTAATLTHFILVYTKNDFISKKINLALLYLPFLFFSGIGFSTDLIKVSAVLSPWWGYRMVPGKLYALLVLFICIFSVIDLILLRRYARITTVEAEGRMTMILFAAMGFPFMLGVTTEFILPTAGFFGIPPLTSSASTLMAVAVAYLARKRGLTTISTGVIAERLLNTLSDCLAVITKDGIITMVNRATSDLFDKKADELIGKPASVISEKITNLLIVLGSVGLVEGFEVEIPNRLGESVDFSINASALKDGRGDIVCFVLVMRDISRSKKISRGFEEKTFELQTKNKELASFRQVMLSLSEDIAIEKQKIDAKVRERTMELSLRTAELSMERNKLELVVQHVQTGAILLDEKGRPILVNRIARDILGVEDEKTAAMERILDALEKKFPEEKTKELVRSCLTGVAMNIPETECGGRIYSIVSSCIPKSAGGSGYGGHLIWMTDITEAKLLERSKTDFVAITSHELRTPLTIIRGSAERLLKLFLKKGGDQDTKEMVGDILDESIRLLRIVNDFLDVTALEEGRMLFRKEPFDLAELIRERLPGLEDKARQKGISVTFDSASMPQVSADRERTKQLLMNLVGNSIQYTKEGGVTVTLERVGQFVKVKITDTGSGIPLDRQGSLFRKFQTVGDRFIRSREYGSGLGLYISRMIAESMGGTAGLENSVPGKGSTFSFSLPVAS